MTYTEDSLSALFGRDLNSLRNPSSNVQLILRDIPAAGTVVQSQRF